MATLLVTSTLDTKGREVAFACERAEVLGAKVVVVDAGILDGPNGIEPSIDSARVARAAGRSLDDVRQVGSRGAAVELMAKGLERLVPEIAAQWGVTAALGIGGLEGAYLAAAALRTLPFGMPKVIVSPIFSGVRRFDPFVGHADIALLHSVADLQGLNAITRAILDRAVRMALVEPGAEPLVAEPRYHVGITLNGNTTTIGTMIAAGLEARGVEVTSFHSNGVGGVAMERLAEEGRFDLIVDLTVNELTEEIANGLFPVLDRLDIDGEVPRVVVPGCLDFVCQEADAIDERFRGRATDEHNPELVLVQVSAAEATQIARAFVDRLSGSRGPVRVIVPMRGISLAGSPDGTFPGAGGPGPAVKALTEQALGRLPLQTVDAPINDRSVADAVLHAVEELLSLDRVGTKTIDASLP